MEYDSVFFVELKKEAFQLKLFLIKLETIANGIFGSEIDILLLQNAAKSKVHLNQSNIF